MRPSLRFVILVLLSGCAGRSAQVAERVAKPAVAPAPASAPPAAGPAPRAASSSASDAKQAHELAVAEVEQRVDQELKHEQSYPEPAPQLEAYSACLTPSPSPLLAACKPGPRAGSCRECPSFTGFAGSDAGRVELLLRGSFSGAYEEALLFVAGCEAHSQNYGGLLLTRKVEGGWVSLVYLPGVVPQHCDASAKLDGASRVACAEAHGLNSGTYETQATVIDFRTRRVDRVLYAMCEDGIDVERVRWTGADKRELQVSVTYGVQRENEGQGCVDVRGKKRYAELTYTEAAGGYAPTPATEKQLSKLKPRDPDQALDPAVADATGSIDRVPSELLPERDRQFFNEPNCVYP